MMADVTIRAEDRYLLPAVCVCCGQLADRTREQEFRYASLWTMLIGARYETTLSLPVCERHKKRGAASNRVFFRGMAATAVVGLVAAVAYQIDPTVGRYLVFLAVGTGLAMAVAAMAQADDNLKATGMTRYDVNLSGVHKKFAAALAARQSGEEVLDLVADR